MTPTAEFAFEPGVAVFAPVLLGQPYQRSHFLTVMAKCCRLVLGKIDEQDVTPKGVKKFFSSQFYKDYEKAMEKRKYWAERKKQTTV